MGMYALPDTHPEHVRVKAMYDALKRLDNEEAGFSIHDVDLIPACPHALPAFLDVISDQDAKERECESSALQGTKYRGRATGFTNMSRMVTAQKRGHEHVLILASEERRDQELPCEEGHRLRPHIRPGLRRRDGTAAHARGVLHAGARRISESVQHGYPAVVGVDAAALVARDLRARVPVH